jgi:hypothetical protein
MSGFIRLKAKIAKKCFTWKYLSVSSDKYPCPLNNAKSRIRINTLIGR